MLFINVVKAESVDLAPHAKTAILVETTTGKILYEKDKDVRRSPASMTKIMTLILTMEALEDGRIKMDDKVVVSKKAASMGGTQIFLEEGSSVDVETLVKGISIASANDASVAIAEFIGGTEENFVNSLIYHGTSKKIALKNRIVSAIYNITTKPQNQLIAHETTGINLIAGAYNANENYSD